jgi:hypothetical protein
MAEQGIAFCEYVDPAATEVAVTGLNNMEIGEKRLVVRKASIGVTQVAGEMSVNAMSMLAGTTSTDPDVSRVLQLLNMVTPEELMDNDDYEGKPTPCIFAIAIGFWWPTDTFSLQKSRKTSTKNAPSTAPSSSSRSQDRPARVGLRPASARSLSSTTRPIALRRRCARWLDGSLRIGQSSRPSSRRRTLTSGRGRSAEEVEKAGWLCTACSDYEMVIFFLRGRSRCDWRRG